MKQKRVISVIALSGWVTTIGLAPVYINSVMLQQTYSEQCPPSCVKGRYICNVYKVVDETVQTLGYI